MTTYRIRNWGEHFEKAQTRACKVVSWVPFPNKHDGKGYRRIMRLKDGAAIYGAWVLIVQVASKCKVRGVLADDDGPLSAKDISDKTGLPEKLVENALKALCSKEIGWVEHVSADSTLIARRNALQLQDRTGQDTTGQGLPTEVCPEPPFGVSGQPSDSASPGDDANQSELIRQPNQKRGTKPAECASTVTAVMVFPCVGRGPTEWPLTEAKLAEYRESFPGIDVLSECRKARQWCIDNPANRKTFGGLPAFLTRWFSKSQNFGGTSAISRRNGPAISQDPSKVRSSDFGGDKFS